MSAGEVFPLTDDYQGEAPSSSSSIKTEYAQDTSTTTYAGPDLEAFIEKGRLWAESRRQAAETTQAQIISQ